MWLLYIISFLVYAVISYFSFIEVLFKGHI